MGKTTSDMIREILHAQFSGDLEAGVAQEIRTWFIGKGHEDEKFSILSELWEKEIRPTHKSSKKLDAEFRQIAKLLDFPEHIRKRAGVGKQNLLRRWTPRVAAVLLPMLIVGAVFLFIDPDSSNAEIAEIPFVTVEAQEGIQQGTILPDSTVIELESGLLTYAEDFTEKREVYIEGEAFFSVSHDPENPFTVKTNSLQIRVYGTEFQIKAYKDSPTAEVKLTSGSVLVTADGIEGLVMTPGQHFIYNKLHHSVTIDDIGEGEMLRLLKQNLSFEGQSLDEVFRMMAQYFGLQFRVAPGISLTERGTISFEDDVTIEEALRLLKLVAQTPFEYYIKEDTVTINNDKNQTNKRKL